MTLHGKLTKSNGIKTSQFTPDFVHMSVREGVKEANELPEGSKSTRYNMDRKSLCVLWW